MDQSDKSKVFLADSSDRASGTGRLLEEFDLAADGMIALKANYNSDDPFPATTDPETLSNLVKGLKAAGSARIIMGERSGMGYTRRVLKNRGVFDLSSRLAFDIMVLDEMGPEIWKDIQAEGLHWRHGFKIARIFDEADKVVQTCCLKTHRFGGYFTMSLKNSVGMVAARPKGVNYDYMRELHSSPYQRLMIAEINKFYDVDLVLMDASRGFVTGGPEKGDLVDPGLLLASNDRVAIDAVGVALLRSYGSTPDIMKGRIFDMEQISGAAALGVGIKSADKIELVPLDDKSHKASEEIGKIFSDQG